MHATIGCGVCSLLIPIILVLFSIDAVEQNEYGLIFNWVTKSLSNHTYHGGTHLIGFWNKFLVFPATIQTIEFSERDGMRTSHMLETRTKEGLGLHLSISFQYLLDPAKLSELFSVTNMRYEQLYVRIARDQLLEAASQYEGPQYWQERQKIGDHMRRLVDENLKQNFASLWGLQLQVIDLPDRYEDSITKTQVQQQIIKTRQNEQVAANIRADTDVLNAQFAKDIQVVQAEAQANFTQETKLAVAEAAKRKIAAEANAVAYVRKALKLSAQDIVRYQQLQSYGGLENAMFLADMPGTGALMGMNVARSLLQEAKPHHQQPAHVAQEGEEASPTTAMPPQQLQLLQRRQQFLERRPLAQQQQ